MIITSAHPRKPAPGHVVDGVAGFEALCTPSASLDIEILHVHFEPGSRTRWHTHPRGQLLLVTAGSGWVQSRGQAARRLGAGDVVVIEPGEEHWHGASATSAMSHLAIQQPDAGVTATALESVTTSDYPDE